MCESVRGASNRDPYPPLLLHDELEIGGQRRPIERAVAVDDALAKLTAIDTQKGRVVELRFFGGPGVEQTAGDHGVSPRTDKWDWSFAGAWLYREIGQRLPGRGRSPGVHLESDCSVHHKLEAMAIIAASTPSRKAFGL